MGEPRTDRIADELEQAIFTGEFADGDRLDEARLAERFGVSRTPVREALLKLAASGLAEQIPHRGVFVKQPGPVELMDMFETMAELEAACARLAAARISDAGLAVLREANAACGATIEAGDVDAYYRENERFHRTIYAESGNAYLEAQVLGLSRRLRPYRRMQLHLRGRMRQSLAEHEAVLEALERGDGALAADRLRGHVAVQGEKFHHLMARMRTAAE